MEDQKIIEDLDSLWFFSNILSSTRLPYVTLSSDENITQSHVLESPISNQQKPTLPNPQTEQGQSANTDSQVETSSEFDSVFESETESAIQEMESFTMRAPAMEKEEMSIIDVTDFEGLRDFGFDFGDIGLDGMLVPMMPRLLKSRNPYLICKMPPLSDGIAMKKHLRLWAHAVACTVK